MIIAVDGPAGAGKSTVAKALAKKLSFLYIDTGAMYRALTLKALNNDLDIADTRALIQLARDTRIDLVTDPDGHSKVLLDGADVSLEIRKPQVTQVVSDIAKIKEVREVMVGLQRKLGRQNECVLDGRDIGTVVFPEAAHKFYIDASFDERVKRRFKDLQDLKITDVSIEEVARDLKNRDTIDSTRSVAPLRKADDAVYIDTTQMGIEEVVEYMFKKAVS